MEFEPFEVQGLEAFKDVDAPLPFSLPANFVPSDSERYVCQLNTMAMGDHNAPEFAQASHLAIGIWSGALSDESLIALGKPLPRSKYSAGLISDDHLGLEKEKAAGDSKL